MHIAKVTGRIRMPAEPGIAVPGFRVSAVTLGAVADGDKFSVYFSINDSSILYAPISESRAGASSSSIVTVI